MTGRRIVRIAVVIAGTALFVQSLRTMGLDRIVEGVGRVGWGFAAVLLLSGAREVARTLAWTRTVDGPASLRFLPAFRARLAGEALNTLLPMGMVLGEPAKASQVQADLPFATAFMALVVEFAFYSASLVLLFGAGVSAFVVLNEVPLGPYAMAFGAAAGVVALIVLATTRWSNSLRDVVFGFASRHPERVPTIIGLEIAYHVCAVAEVYVTLLLVSPVRPTLAAAIVLETVNRIITMVFKMLPMRVGVDEVGSSIFAGRVALNPATGLTLALVRKLRLLFWSAVGLALLARRPAVVAVPRRSPALLGVVLALTLVAANLSAAQPPPAIVAGTVSIVSPEAQPLVVPGVTLTLTCARNKPEARSPTTRSFDLPTSQPAPAVARSSPTSRASSRRRKWSS